MAFTQVPSKLSGDVFSVTMWNTYIETNLNKLGVQMHRQLSVAAFLALTGLEDGDEAYVEVDGTNGVVWHLRYDAGSTKWRFLGGPPLVASVATDEASAGTSYADLATAGPSITCPLGGVMDLSFGANIYNTATPARIAMISPSIAGAGATDANSAGSGGAGTTSATTTRAQRTDLRVTGLAATNVVKLQYKDPPSGGRFKDRMLSLKPVTTP